MFVSHILTGQNIFGSLGRVLL